MTSRRESRPVLVGGVPMGGGAPIAVQSMTNTPTTDVEATLAQIGRLADAGCEVIRVAIPRADALDGFQAICERSPLPVVADIHFDHRLAIEATHRGAAKLRINPGNIGDLSRVDAVIDAAGEAGIPIRIGVNAGSLAPEYHDLDWPLPEKLAASAVAFCDHFEARGFSDIVVSAKASSVLATIEAYRLLADRVPYPLHIGVTEAGTAFSGTVKSSVGLGVLLEQGIGDTLRVSLTAAPEEEARVAWEILAALDIRRRGPELISCPTCGRCQVDLVPIASEVERRLREMDTPIKVAVMGCVVNGPGEARDADVGVAAGRGVGLVFCHGQPVRKVPESEIVDALFEEIDSLG
ncbi:MAG: flavodoxin-dependent (E)-4-hydroxy-3-methylbut-2-enyl-diphosphate synthase [Coriobacteriia bacterium]